MNALVECQSMGPQRISEIVARVLPATAGEEIRRNLHAALSAALERMDLVTREELETQERVLGRTREMLETLEQRVAELEQQGRVDS